MSYCILEEKLPIHIWWRGLFLKTNNS